MVCRVSPLIVLSSCTFLLAVCQAYTTLPLTGHRTDLSAVLRRIELQSGVRLRKRDDFLLNGWTSGGLTYTVDISLDQGPKLPVIVDTGSNQFWVPASSCETCVTGGMTSSSLEAPDGCLEIALIYGIGTVNGCIESTTLQVDQYEIKDMHVLAVKHLDGNMQWQGEFMSGIWGMARDNKTPDGSPTAVSLMYQQGVIKTPTVGFYLARQGKDKQSEMTIGDVSSLPYTNTDRQVTLQSVGSKYDLYTIILDAITVNGKVLSHGKGVIVDTGSTSIATPEPLIGDIYTALFGDRSYKYNGRYIVPCEPLTNATLSLTFGGIAFDMAAIDLVGSAIQENYQWCYGRFIPAFEGLEEMVIGDAFLHNVYHTVNVETGEVTFYDLQLQ